MLPFDLGAVLAAGLALVGPAADDAVAMMGSYSGAPPFRATLRDALHDAAAAAGGGEVAFARGCAALNCTSDALFAEVEVTWRRRSASLHHEGEVTATDDARCARGGRRCTRPRRGRGGRYDVVLRRRRRKARHGSVAARVRDGGERPRRLWAAGAAGESCVAFLVCHVCAEAGRSCRCGTLSSRRECAEGTRSRRETAEQHFSRPPCKRPRGAARVLKGRGVGAKAEHFFVTCYAKAGGARQVSFYGMILQYITGGARQGNRCCRAPHGRRRDRCGADRVAVDRRTRRRAARRVLRRPGDRGRACRRARGRCVAERPAAVQRAEVERTRCVRIASLNTKKLPYSVPR